MKKMILKSNFKYFSIIKISVLGLCALMSSCTAEQIEREEEIGTVELSSTNESFATPVVGGIYAIHNLRSNRTLDVSGGSNINNANVQLWGTNKTSPPTHRQWEVISTDNGYVRLRCVDSQKTLQTGRTTTTGGNVNQYAYADKDWQEWSINSVGNGYFSLENRYSNKVLTSYGANNGDNVVIHDWVGASTQRWFFTEIGGVITTPTGDTAAEIIGSGWKLNGYTGNLNVSNSNDNGLDYDDDSSTSESHYFFEKDGYAAFRCYPGNPTSSSGTSNPRSELRELIRGGSNYWDGTTSTQRSMKMRFKVEDLPPSGKLAFMQIHERVDPFDDVVRIQVQGSSGQNSGSVDLRINGYVTEDIEGQGRTIDFDMNMDTEYYFELTMQNGVVTLYNLNSSGNRSQTLFRSVDIGDADENYFKAGCYLQSTSSSDENSNVYGQVLIKDLVVNPND